MEFQQITVYVPESHLDAVKNALFSAGAGRIGAYDMCCWQTAGIGQFRPLEGSDPFIGEPGRVETVKEWKLELLCSGERLAAALAAMKEAHPYETPAFHVSKVYDSP
jgi:hypothetical protein